MKGVSVRASIGLVVALFLGRIPVHGRSNVRLPQPDDSAYLREASEKSTGRHKVKDYRPERWFGDCSTIRLVPKLRSWSRRQFRQREPYRGLERLRSALCCFPCLNYAANAVFGESEKSTRSA